MGNAHGIRVQRWCEPGVTPLEIWDLPVPGGLLWQRAGAGRLAEAGGAGERERRLLAMGADLGRALAAAGQGRSGLRWAGAADSRWVYLTGGLAAEPVLVGAVWDVLDPDLQVIAAAGAEARFPGEEAGLWVASQLGQRRACVVDVGQTSVKASLVGHGNVWRGVVMRDMARLPMAYHVGYDTLPVAYLRDQYREAVAFVGEAVAAALQGAPAEARGGALVLGLPCELGPDLMPGHCTYAGWMGRAELAGDLAAAIAARLETGFEWAVAMNDAELAGVAVKTRLRAGGGAAGKGLVVTLGFGPGGAIVDLGGPGS